MSNNPFAAIFKKNKRSIPNTVMFYETEQEDGFFKKFVNFPAFVAVAVISVVVVIALVLLFNKSSNVLTEFVNASSKAFDSGSFDYHITVSENDVTCMDYSGALNLDVDKQGFVSSYHAKYSDYEYDTVVYTYDEKAYHGNYYDGKWTITDDTDVVLDFIDFYLDYKDGNFDGGAFVRFTNTTKKFNPSQLAECVNDVIEQLSTADNIENVLNMHTQTTDTGTTVTFKPKMDKVFAIIAHNSGPAFVSANDYSNFCKRVTKSHTNLQNTVAVFSYSINYDGFLTDISLDYTLSDKHYIISAKIDNFGQSDVKIPDGFFVAAGIDED